MLPITVGQTGDGGSEFGDIYHVGAALFLDKALRSVLVGEGDLYNKYYHFLTKLAETERVERLTYDLYRDRQKKFARAGKSTDVIQKVCAQPDAIDRLQSFILCHIENDIQIEEVRNYIQSKKIPQGQLVLIWIRSRRCWQPKRNSTVASIRKLEAEIKRSGMNPVFVGHEIGDQQGGLVLGCDFIRFSDSDLFKKDLEFVCRQLLLFHILKRDYRLIASVGMMSGGMDGPAIFLQIPTLWFSKDNDAGRMNKLQPPILKHFHRITIPPGDGDFVQHTDEEIGKLLEFLAHYRTKV